MRRYLLMTISIMAVLAAGCGSSTSPASDSGVTPDGQPDGATVKSWSFVPDDDGSKSPAVTLKADGASTDGSMWLKVVARGIPDLQGVAFRLSFDPQRVQVAQSEAGSAWQVSSTKHVAKFKARSEGELWAGLGHVGQGALVAQSETTLARVKLSIKGNQPTTIDFRPNHNMVLSSQGTAVQSSWLGGKLQPVND